MGETKQTVTKLYRPEWLDGAELVSGIYIYLLSIIIDKFGHRSLSLSLSPSST